jgi:superfamily I DNA/RNA helicase
MEPLLIITGAGSGKTNTLAQRVAQVVTLGRDYQSTQPIPTAANAPISRATARATAELRSGGSSV